MLSLHLLSSRAQLMDLLAISLEDPLLTPNRLVAAWPIRFIWQFFFSTSLHDTDFVCACNNFFFARNCGHHRSNFVRTHQNAVNDPISLSSPFIPCILSVWYKWAGVDSVIRRRLFDYAEFTRRCSRLAQMSSRWTALSFFPERRLTDSRKNRSRKVHLKGITAPRLMFCVQYAVIDWAQQYLWLHNACCMHNNDINCQ